MLETGLICRGAETIFIVDITLHKWEYTWEKCRQLNRLMRDLYQQRQFVYIDNSNNYVDRLVDGVHLSNAGSKILATSYLKVYAKGFCISDKDGISIKDKDGISFLQSCVVIFLLYCM